MKKILILIIFFWLIHFHGGSPLQVDRVEYDHDKPYFFATKDGKTIVIPWVNVLYIEEK